MQDPNETSAAQWFYGQDGRQHGPFTEEGLRQMAATGQLRRDALLWRAGMAEWSPASILPGLFPPAQPPPLPANVTSPYAAAPTIGSPVFQPQPIAYATALPPPPEESATMRMLLPVGRSGWAIAAGYLGLLSLIPFVAPVAVIIAIIAIMDMRRNPNKHGMGRAIFGLVMGALFSLGSVFLLVRALM